MSTIEKSQMVPQDRTDEVPKMVEQSVSIDTEDMWITLQHDAGENTMEIENFYSLMKLANELLEELKNK